MRRPIVERTARALAMQVHNFRVMRQAEFWPQGIPTADAEAQISNAASQGWVVDDDGLLRAGSVSPYLPEPTAEAGVSDHWTHRFFTRA